VNLKKGPNKKTKNKNKNPNSNSKLPLYKKTTRSQEKVCIWQIQMAHPQSVEMASKSLFSTLNPKPYLHTYLPRFVHMLCYICMCLSGLFCVIHVAFPSSDFFLLRGASSIGPSRRKVLNLWKQNLWDKVWCYWEHVEEHIGNLLITMEFSLLKLKLSFFFYFLLQLQLSETSNPRKLKKLPFPKW
jgi:hypothetical protein